MALNQRPPLEERVAQAIRRQARAYHMTTLVIGRYVENHPDDYDTSNDLWRRAEKIMGRFLRLSRFAITRDLILPIANEAPEDLMRRAASPKLPERTGGNLIFNQERDSIQRWAAMIDEAETRGQASLFQLGGDIQP